MYVKFMGLKERKLCFLSPLMSRVVEMLTVIVWYGLIVGFIRIIVLLLLVRFLRSLRSVEIRERGWKA